MEEKLQDLETLEQEDIRQGKYMTFKIAFLLAKSSSSINILITCLLFVSLFSLPFIQQIMYFL